LTESTSQLNQWREKILAAVGNNGQVLIDVIPNLELIIGKQPAVASVGFVEAQNRFNLCFQYFMHAISQPEHPLVLFIDDWQWADSASMGLLSTLMADKENQSLLIIGAYRDNEVNAAHPFMITVETLKKANAIITTIQLSNLSHYDINALIAETLAQGCKVTLHPLTQLVYEKTQGNAFFTREFLKSLYAQGLLVFDWQTQRWQWDIDQIAVQEMTDNVVELMADKISQLPTETISALKLAACIGNSFELNTLSIIYQQALQITLQHLWNSIEEGLIFPLNDNYKLFTDDGLLITEFQFQHDRVQQAAYSLIADTDKKSIHLQIGRLLLANTKLAELENSVFDIVNQLNEGRELIEDNAEKLH
jgi:predicted ATPase